MYNCENPRTQYYLIFHNNIFEYSNNNKKNTKIWYIPTEN